jgi:hypothetical protein
MSQSSEMLTHMKRGKRLTRLIALYEYRVQNITARIRDLRKAGWNIKTTKRRDAHNAIYAEYYLGKPHKLAS